jgi:UDPglucose--hexose-1-phosphate uridylyltransferase
MPELRQNFFTKEWVVIATERAKRPEQLISQRSPGRRFRCPRIAPFARATRTRRRPKCHACPMGWELESACHTQQVCRARA